jgi:uncharacterized protein (DUF1330 family)
VGIKALYAQAKSPIYMIAINDVKDAEGYVKEYTAPAAASIVAHGGVTIARGFGTIIDGSLPGERAIVVRWDSLEQLKAWRDSPEYTTARKLGDKYAKFNIIAIDAVKQ